MAKRFNLTAVNTSEWIVFIRSFLLFLKAADFIFEMSVSERDVISSRAKHQWNFERLLPHFFLSFILETCVFNRLLSTWSSASDPSDVMVIKLNLYVGKVTASASWNKWLIIVISSVRVDVGVISWTHPSQSRSPRGGDFGLFPSRSFEVRIHRHG